MDVYVLNKDFTLISCIDDYTSLIWTERYWSCGDFELVIPMEVWFKHNIQTDYYISIPHSKRYMIVEKIESSKNSDGVSVTISGRSLEIILDRRIIHFGWILNQELQQNIETLMHMYFLTPGDTKRRVDDMIFTRNSDVNGPTLNHDVAGESVYEAIKMVTKENNLGFSLLYNNDCKLELKLLKGIDRSLQQTTNDIVLFSTDADNLIDANYYESIADSGNVVVIAGGENWGNRRVEMVSNGDVTGLYRRERYKSSEATAEEYGSEYANILRQQGVNELLKLRPAKTFDGVIEPTLYYTYGVDYNIGDIVQISDNLGHSASVRITEFIISVDENGVSMYPSFEQLDDIDVDENVKNPKIVCSTNSINLGPDNTDVLAVRMSNEIYYTAKLKVKSNDDRITTDVTDLQFNPSNWFINQEILVTADFNSILESSTYELLISSDGFESVTVLVKVVVEETAKYIQIISD